MAKGKKRGRPSAAARRIEEDGPTLETVLKARTHAMPKLPRWAEEAAAAIELGYNLVVKDVMPKVGSVEPRITGGKTEMSDADAAAVKKYHRWVKRMEQHRVPLDPVISVIVDGMDPREVDIRLGRIPKPGESSWTAGLLLQALALFATRSRDVA